MMLILVTLGAFAQNQGDDLEYLRMMESGVEHMESGDYETADQYFRMVIDNMTALPTEICYYFGKNSFQLEKYKQSIDWLNKYIELKGVKGKFFDESVSLLEKSEQAYRAQQDTNLAQESQTTPSEQQSLLNKIDCEGGRSVICPECKGEGVVTKPGVLGAQIYTTCIYGESGVLSCEEYKLYLQGALTPKED